ncbi:hypothetical protein Hypma_006395 [Hypsizygus marmoreus]|uniref:Uncharacterized protein n=1 Tax=Hypsizygus marmoreus TaxID=39966 RepID=A0A369K095_HYPMA|nr:hypothetical protein Hypma_006395 [Hypsizygus marmoreus]
MSLPGPAELQLHLESPKPDFPDSRKSKQPSTDIAPQDYGNFTPLHRPQPPTPLTDIGSPITSPTPTPPASVQSSLSRMPTHQWTLYPVTMLRTPISLSLSKFINVVRSHSNVISVDKGFPPHFKKLWALRRRFGMAFLATCPYPLEADCRTELTSKLILEQYAEYGAYRGIERKGPAVLTPIASDVRVCGLLSEKADFCVALEPSVGNNKTKRT